MQRLTMAALVHPRWFQELWYCSMLVSETRALILRDVIKQQPLEQLVVSFIIVVKLQASFFSLVLFSNQSDISGSLTIPSGSISLEDAMNIITTVNANPSAIYTFTDLVERTPVVSELKNSL